MIAGWSCAIAADRVTAAAWLLELRDQTLGSTERELYRRGFLEGLRSLEDRFDFAAEVQIKLPGRALKTKPRRYCGSAPVLRCNRQLRSPSQQTWRSTWLMNRHPRPP
ncbi:hypothetical protein MPLA_670076 [Mesorhizobium sp. ORS 3359]|nr:hypothetical protein MPLA_670076 [Mesorhizobium sp. ORS 3359]